LGATVETPVLRIERSAEALATVDAVAELFPGVGSGVVEVTVAVFDTGPEKVGPTVYVLVMVALAAGANVPTLHG